MAEKPKILLKNIQRKVSVFVPGRGVSALGNQCVGCPVDSSQSSLDRERTASLLLHPLFKLMVTFYTRYSAFYSFTEEIVWVLSFPLSV